MSQIKIHGDDAFETVGSTITYGMNGVEGATGKYLLGAETYTLESASSWALDQLGESHGNYDHLRCVNVNATNQGPFIEVTFVYRGIGDTSGTALSITAGLSTEPIDTHKDFEDFAGTSEEPKNGAIFNDDGTFKGFDTNSGNCPQEEEIMKAGVKSYLSPSVIVEAQTYIDKGGYVDLNEVGEIASSIPAHKPAGANSSGGKPSFSSRDWLIIGSSLEPIGKQMIVKKKYRLSGKDKWNKDIYE
jgi:hypothetical protein